MFNEFIMQIGSFYIGKTKQVTGLRSDRKLLFLCYSHHQFEHACLVGGVDV